MGYFNSRHCTHGMVAAINAPDSGNNTFQDFQVSKRHSRCLIVAVLDIFLTFPLSQGTSKWNVCNINILALCNIHFSIHHADNLSRRGGPSLCGRSSCCTCRFQPICVYARGASGNRFPLGSGGFSQRARRACGALEHSSSDYLSARMTRQSSNISQ